MAVLNETAAGEREKCCQLELFAKWVSFRSAKQRSAWRAGLCNLRNLHRTPVAYALLRQIAAAPWGAIHYPPAVGETRSASQNASCAPTACRTNAFLISKDPSALHLHKLLPKEAVRAFDNLNTFLDSWLGTSGIPASH